MQSELHCECPCGASKLAVVGPPFARFSCHCTICQSVYKRPCSDESIVWARHVTIQDPRRIRFERHRRPPAASRGVCSDCRSPVVAFISLAPFMRIAVIPSHLFEANEVLPPLAAHIFYHNRIRDFPDALPKHYGYAASQFAALRLILRGAIEQVLQRVCPARAPNAPAA